MERAAIAEKIAEMIKSQLKVDRIDLTADLQKQYNIDSIGVLDFIMSVEDAFEIQFADDALTAMKTVDDVVDHVEELMA